MISHKAEAIIKSSGELVEIEISTPEEITEAYALVEDTLIAYRNLRTQITNRGMQLLKEKG